MIVRNIARELVQTAARDITFSEGTPAPGTAWLADMAGLTLVNGLGLSRASAGGYFNSAGVWSSATTNAPRFDYNPATLAFRGLLVEEQRTNSLRNGACAGATTGVVGSGGAYPTNMSAFGGLSGGSVTIAGFGTTAGGLPYFDIQMQVSSASDTSFQMRFEGGTQVVASSGQTWTGSAYVALVGGGLSGVNSTNLRLRANAGGSDSSSTETVTTAFTPTATLDRATCTATLASGSTTRLGYHLVVNYSTGASFNFTLRVAAPQLELGGFATSFISTSGTAATRAADMLTAALGSWFNAGEGTVVANFRRATTPVSGTAPALATLDDGSADNRIKLYHSPSNTGCGLMRAGGSAVFDQAASGSVSLSNLNRLAVAYKNADHAVCLNGGSVSNLGDASLASGLTTLRLGADSGGGVMSGWLRKVAYYDSRLPDAMLQTLTA